MKKQIITFIIGALVGAIITTGVFLIIKGNSKDSNQGPQNWQMKEFNGERPDNNAKGKGQTKTQEIKTDKSSNT